MTTKSASNHSVPPSVTELGSLFSGPDFISHVPAVPRMGGFAIVPATKECMLTETAREILGFEGEESVGYEDFLRRFSDAGIRFFRALEEKDGEIADPLTTDETVVDPSGNPVYIRVVAAVYTDKKLRVIQGALQDFSAIRAILLRAQAQKQIVGTLLQAISEYIFLLDKDGVILDCRFAGKPGPFQSFGQLIGKGPEDFLPKAERKRYQNAVAKAVRTASPVSYDFEYTDSSGAHGYSCKIHHLGEGDRFLVIVQDKTDLAENRIALQKSEIRYRTILENAPFPVFITRIADGAFLYLNRRAKDQFLRDDMPSDNAYSSRIYAYPEQREDLIRRFSVTGTLTDYELQLKNGNGEFYWAHLSASTVEYGDDPAMMVSVSDINDRKTAELELKKEREKLIAKVREQECLQSIFEVTEDDAKPVQKVLQAAVDRAAQCFLSLDPVLISLDFDGELYLSADLATSDRFLYAESRITTGESVRITFSFRDEKPNLETEYFAAEEKNLFDSFFSRVIEVLNRRSARELIHEQNEFVRVMFDQTTDSISLIEPRTLQFISFNEMAHEHLGYTREEFRGLSVAAIQTQYEPDQIREFGERIPVGGTLRVETIHRAKDGSPQNVLLQLSTLKLLGNTYVCALWRDITEEKMREKEQYRITERLLLHTRLIRRISAMRSGIDGEVALFVREVTELLSRELSIPIVSVWSLESDRKTLACLSLYDNRTAKYTHGIRISEERAADTSAYHLPERYIRSDQVKEDERLSYMRSIYLEPFDIRSLLQASIVFQGHHQGNLSFAYSGETHVWDATEISFCCEVADQIGMAFLNHDRIEATRALQHSEYFLKRAQAVSKTGHWFYDFAGNSLSCSDETCRIFAMPPEKNRTLESFLSRCHPEDVQIVRDAFRAARRGKPFVITYRIVSGGRVRWVEKRAEIEFDTKRHPVTCLGTVQDITEKLEATRELDEYRQHLEEMVRLRTAELEEAKHAAEAANEAKSSFLSNMSHEIRTPINAIVGFAYLLRQDPLTARQSDELNKLAESSTHLLQIINDILDLSKIEAGKVTLDTYDFEPSEIVDKICNLVQEDAARKNLPITVDLDNVPTLLRGDGNRLGQILLNLMSNAVKFTDAGGIYLTARVAKENEGRVVLSFSVRDTGIGIADEQIKSLFTEFEQATNSTTRNYGGTGLGLPISKRLTELMGGTIRVESAVGKGSVFLVTIPFERAASTPSLPPDLARLAGKRVLIADDEKDARLILSSILRGFGLRPDFVDSGEKALEAITAADREKKPYSILLLDYRMPGMNGIETLRSLDLLHLSQAPAVILATAYGSELKASYPFEKRLPSILTKPVTPSKLREALLSAVSDFTASPFELTQTAPTDALRFTGSRILLAEDNPINREVAIGLLTSKDIAVDSAQNGTEAVQMVREGDYDLVLMDVQMPETDGIEATKRIREGDIHSDIPIIAMTAVAFEEDRRRCLDAGMDDYLSKPVDPDELFGVLGHWLTPVPASEPDSTPGAPTTSADADGRFEEDEKSVSVRREPDPDLFERLNAIPGLRADFGLSNLQGDLAWYARLLRQFVGRHLSDAADMADFLSYDDTTSIGKIAHNLKGTAATLGLSDIQKYAANMEEEIRAGADRKAIRETIEKLDATLSFTSDALNEAIGQPAEDPSKRPELVGRADEIRKILERIQADVKVRNTEAETIFGKNRDLLFTALGGAADRLEHNLQLFDYDDAEEQIDELLKEWRQPELNTLPPRNQA